MFSFAVTGLAFAAVVSAQTAGYHAINLPGMQEVVPACAPYTIVWTPSDQFSGDVTFQLIGGATQLTLVPIGGMFGSKQLPTRDSKSRNIIANAIRRGWFCRILYVGCSLRCRR